MIRLLRVLASTTIAISLISSNRAGAHVLPSGNKTERVKITKGPELESASDYLTIIRWTTNNPWGVDVHYGIVQYGTNPRELSQTAKNPIRLNRCHPETVFRVRILGLRPRTTYYYTVASEETGGKSDGVNS